MLRRSLLWLLPILGGCLFLVWGLRDAPLLGLDLFGVKWIVYPGQECRRNLSRLRDAAQAWRDHAEAFPVMDELPTQAECWWLLTLDDPTIASLDCPLIHNPINACWHTSGPRTPDPHAPYVINPHLFTRPTSEWRDSDVVAADSMPRHIATTEGPGIRCVFLVRWDHSIQQAYVPSDQSLSLIQHLDDFAAGTDRRDRDEVWSPYYDRPGPR